MLARFAMPGQDGGSIGGRVVGPQAKKRRDGIIRSIASIIR